MNSAESNEPVKALKLSGAFMSPASALEAPMDVWVIEKLVSGLTLLYGEDSTLKSFLSISWGLAISSGQESWYGHRIEKPGPVIHIVGEGGRSAWGERTWAAAQEFGLSNRAFQEVPFFGYPLPVDLTSFGNAQSRAFLESAREVLRLNGLSGASLLIIDTYSTCMPKDQNPTEGVSAFQGTLATLKSELAIESFLVVHHAGKNGDVRGSSALSYAADCRHRLTRPGRKKNSLAPTILEVEKLRSEEVGEKLTLHPFKEKILNLDGSERRRRGGTPVSSLRLTAEASEVPGEEDPPVPPGPPAWLENVLQVLGSHPNGISARKVREAVGCGQPAAVKCLEILRQEGKAEQVETPSGLLWRPLA